MKGGGLRGTPQTPLSFVAHRFQALRDSLDDFHYGQQPRGSLEQVQLGTSYQPVVGRTFHGKCHVRHRR